MLHGKSASCFQSEMEARSLWKAHLNVSCALPVHEQLILNDIRQEIPNSASCLQQLWLKGLMTQTSQLMLPQQNEVFSANFCVGNESGRAAPMLCYVLSQPLAQCTTQLLYQVEG